MSPASSAAPPADAPLHPRTLAAIARAERRREVLERLSDLGARLAQDIAERALQAPRATEGPNGEPAPEPRHDPGRAFAAVSRAVRFSLALEARIDAEILALMRGDAPPAPRGWGDEGEEKPVWTPRPPPDAFARRRNKVGACIWDAIEEGFTDAQAADDLCLVAHERLFESEVYDELLFGSFRESVEAICRDLGLSPDWSRWDDEVGFPPETRRTDHRWTEDWATWPSGAKAKRAYYAADRQIAALKAAAAANSS